MDDNIPRRAYVERQTPAERAIREAMLAVEEAGAHPLLTEAVVLLQQAFDKAADYTDTQPERCQEELERARKEIKRLATIAQDVWLSLPEGPNKRDWLSLHPFLKRT